MVWSYAKEHWPRSRIHVSLYVGAFVNFGFVWLWISGLTNLQCGTPVSIQIGPFTLARLEQCGIQFVGIIIFASSLVGAVQMILYYDDANKSLLKKKREKLVSVSVETMQTLSDAIQVVASLHLKLEKLSDELLLTRWDDCVAVLGKCSNGDTKKKLASIFTESMNSILATALVCINQTNLQEKALTDDILWVRVADQPQVMEKAKCKMCDGDMQHTYAPDTVCVMCGVKGVKLLCTREGCGFCVCEGDSQGKKLKISEDHELIAELLQAVGTITVPPPATGSKGSSSSSSDSDSTKVEEKQDEWKSLLRYRYKLFLKGAEPSPDPKVVLHELLLRGADYWAFPRCLLVKPWEKWVNDFKGRCDKFTESLRDAGVYINLTADVLEQQVIRREVVQGASQCPGLECRSALEPLKEGQEERCFACQKPAKWSCASCPVRCCQACKGLPKNRKLQAIYATSPQGLLIRPAIYNREDEKEVEGEVAKELMKKVRPEITEGQGPASGGQASSQCPTSEAPQTMFCAVAEVKGHDMGGCGSCSGGYALPSFCLPCSFAREWYSCVKRSSWPTCPEICYTRDNGDVTFPDEAPSCSFFSPHKKCAILCWKLEITSYLHERLIIGATFSFLYGTVQSAFVLWLVWQGCHAWDCWVLLGGKAIGALFLFLYFVNSVLCLLNLEHLDVNIEYVKDIEKLEKLHQHLGAFNDLKIEAKMLEEVCAEVERRGPIMIEVHEKKKDIEKGNATPESLLKKLQKMNAAKCGKCQGSMKRAKSPDKGCAECKKTGTTRSCEKDCDFHLCKEHYKAS